MSEQQPAGPTRKPTPRLNTANLGSTPLGNPAAYDNAQSPAQSPRVAEEWSTTPPALATRRTRHTHKAALGPKWHKDYSQIDKYAGRVLVIDFVKQDETKLSMRKVAAQEIFNIESLRKVYNSKHRNSDAVLRVFHVQNAEWATRFLLRKFNIDNRDDLVGTDFGKYVRHKRPERRGGKPFLNGRTWKVQHDPWRGISKTSFGMDYLKEYRVRDPEQRTPTRRQYDNLKMMELNCFNDDDNPEYGYDVYVQRLSCYIQHKQAIVEQPPSPSDPNIKNPYALDSSTEKNSRHEYVPRLNTLDNGNAILIFDNSHSGSIEDTLIPARQMLEARWRRLPFFLAFESRDLVENDEQLAYQCSRVILEDTFKALAGEWDGLLDIATDHVSILEDKVYEQPADETRAPELWGNSSSWLKMEKLLWVHIDIVKNMRTRLAELTEDLETDETWLDNVPADFDRLSNVVTEDLVKPTETLISLLYQSVSIRDSRYNIQLSVSMATLSWVSFVFLPLTFVTGVFGMNVDTFTNDPSIKWYFIISVPVMLGVLALWYLLRQFLGKRRQNPYQRGIYENFFHSMADANPSLWSRMGPRNYIVPKSRLAKIKWALIKRWSAPEKTIRPGGEERDPTTGVPVDDDLGVVSKFKRYLIMKWTAQVAQDTAVSTLGLEAGENLDLDDGASDIHIADGLAEATEMLTIPATPALEYAHLPAKPSDGEEKDDPAYFERARDPVPRLTPFQHLHRRSSSAGRSSSVGRNSQIVVEEEDSGWLSRQGEQGNEFVWRSSTSRDRSRREDADRDHDEYCEHHEHQEGREDGDKHEDECGDDGSSSDQTKRGDGREMQHDESSGSSSRLLDMVPATPRVFDPAD